MRQGQVASDNTHFVELWSRTNEHRKCLTIKVTRLTCLRASSSNSALTAVKATETGTALVAKYVSHAPTKWRQEEYVHDSRKC